MDEHHPVNEELADLGHLDDAAGFVVNIGDDIGDGIDQDVEGPDAQPEPSWIPGADGALQDDPFTDATPDEGWGAGAHDQALPEFAHSDTGGASAAEAPSPPVRSGPEIELPLGHGSDFGLGEIDPELPGMAPLADDGETDRDGLLLGDPLDEVRSFDADDTSAPVLLAEEADVHDESGIPNAVQFDDDFGLDELGAHNAGWGSGAVVAALTAVLGIRALRGRVLRRVNGTVPVACDVVQLLEDSGVEARVEYGNLGVLERALAEGDRVIIQRVSGAGTGGAWEEQPLVVLSIDRAAQLVFLSLAEPEHADARGHGTQVLAPEFGMRLGSFVDAWADSVGEIIVVEPTGDAAKVLLLPISVPDGLLRPVEDLA